MDRQRSHFQIDWSKPRRLDEQTISYDPEIFSFWPIFQQAVFRLSYFYHCDWFIVINNHRLHFNYRPDLTTVFFKLPEMLKHVTDNAPDQYELYFFEQGTDFNIIIENSGKYVSLSFKKYGYSRFDHLPSGKIRVSKRIFCKSWISFIEKVLKELVKEDPGIIDIQGFKDYLGNIRRIKRLWKAHNNSI